MNTQHNAVLQLQAHFLHTTRVPMLVLDRVGCITYVNDDVLRCSLVV